MPAEEKNADREYPPQPVVHAADCPTATALAVAVEPSSKVLLRHPYARPHRCLPGGWTTSYHQPVIVETVVYPEHDYESSTMWPAAARRALCRVCRGTHPEGQG